VRTLDDYEQRNAQRIFERHPSLVHGTPQAMLCSFVLVSFTADRNERLVELFVYRTNGDDEASPPPARFRRRTATLRS